MKKILAMLCAALLLPHSIAAETQSLEDVITASSDWAEFRCHDRGKRYCKHMVDCDEATFHWAICERADLDGDKDNMPCEKVCPHVFDCGGRDNGK